MKSFFAAMVLAASFVARAGAGSEFKAVSPDALNEVRLEVRADGMSYSVWRRGKALVEPTEISLCTKEHGWMKGGSPKAETRKVEGKVPTPIYKKSEVDLAANETRVDFGDWAVALHARNDGVAWRFETEFDGEATVTAEDTNVRFPKDAVLCYGQVGGWATSFERPTTIGPVESVKAGHPQIVITPLTASVAGAGVVCVTESNLLDYPGLNFYRKEGETDTLRSWQAGVPLETERNGRWIRVKARRPYLAKTAGTRAYPWRVFVLGDAPSDLVSSDTVYALAEPCRLDDTSWIKPGLVQWDWWHGFRITDVPGLKSGCNYETYKAYIDYASESGIPYIIMDEGWSEHLNLDKPRAAVDVQGVIDYGKEKGVGVILWAAWSMLYDPADRERVFDRYAAMGAKGFKIDFMDRDDQDLERFLEKTAADAAKRKLVVMYHGIHKPTGLCRTFPNVLNYEGVYGLEQGHSRGGQHVVVANDVNLPYTRMVAGAMDYTPGAMRNRAFNAPEFQKGVDAPACYGTRCHQLALFPLFEAPVQMLCDSPTQYRTAPECFAYIGGVPTVWDETVGVAGEIGAFACVARRKGREWWLGAITNWEARELELPTDFLGGGEWKVEAFEDADDADVNAEHYVHRVFTIKAGEPLKVRLAPGGGFAAKFSPVQKTAAKEPIVRVMTYNIRNSVNDRNSKDKNWGARRDDLARLVEDENADVIGFQEVMPDQREWLEVRFPDYAFTGEGRNADRINGESSPVAFRKSRFTALKGGTFWLSETPDESGTKSWNAALPRICTYAVLKDNATGKIFSFANTHTDHKSELAREKGMLLIIKRMNDFAKDAPIVLAGDHNCLEYEKPAVEVSKILKDAMYLSEAAPEGPWRTFNYWHWKDVEEPIAKALKRGVHERSIPGDDSDFKRIDYIYVSPGTRVTRFATIARPRTGSHLYPSDHFPTVAELIFK